MPKRRVGYRLSEALLVDLKRVLKNEGVSQRKKSAWICQAIVNLLTRGAEQIITEDLTLGDRINPQAMTDVVSMETDLCNAMDNMIYEIRCRDPLAYDLQSVLIRAAIRRGILDSGLGA